MWLDVEPQNVTGHGHIECAGAAAQQPVSIAFEQSLVLLWPGSGWFGRRIARRQVGMTCPAECIVVAYGNHDWLAR